MLLSQKKGKEQSKDKSCFQTMDQKLVENSQTDHNKLRISNENDLGGDSFSNWPMNNHLITSNF